MLYSLLPRLSTLLGLESGMIDTVARQAQTLAREFGVKLPAGGKGGIGGAGSVSGLVLLLIRMALLGYAYKGLKQAWAYVVEYVMDRLFPTAYIMAGDPSILWVDAYLAQDPSVQSQIHTFRLHCYDPRESRVGRNAVRVVGANGMNGANGTWTHGEIIGQILPTQTQTIRIKHEGDTLWINRTSARVVIRTIALQPQALTRFIISAHQRFYASSQAEVLIFHPIEASSSVASTWGSPVSRPTRSWSSVILPPEVKEAVLDDMMKFLGPSKRGWYGDRGIPYRRGYLFHGIPGSGKTTLTMALASRLQLDIYVLSLSHTGLNDAALAKLCRGVRPKSIILIEDIDRIFPIRSAQEMLAEKVLYDTESQDIPPAPPPARPSMGDIMETTTPPDVDNSRPVESSREVTTPGPTPVSAVFPVLQPAQAVVEAVVAKRPKTSGGRPKRHHPNVAPPVTSRQCGVTMSGLLNAIDGVASQEGCILIASTNHPERLDAALVRPGRFDIFYEFKGATRDQTKDLFRHFYASSTFAQQDEKEEEKPADIDDELEAQAEEFAEILFPLMEDEEAGKEPREEALVPGAGGSVENVNVKPIAMAAIQGYLLQHADVPIEAVAGASQWVNTDHRRIYKMTE